ATATNFNNVGGTLGDTSEFTLNREINESTQPTAFLIADPTLICPGSPVDLMLSITGGGLYDLQWSDGFEQENVTSPVERTVNPLVTTMYSVIVTDTFGCPTTSNTVTVTVSVPTISLTAVPASTVPGGEVTLTATPSGNAPFTLTWFDGLVQAGVTGAVS